MEDVEVGPSPRRSWPRWVKVCVALVTMVLLFVTLVVVWSRYHVGPVLTVDQVRSSYFAGGRSSDGRLEWDISAVTVRTWQRTAVDSAADCSRLVTRLGHFDASRFAVNLDPTQLLLGDSKRLFEGVVVTYGFESTSAAGGARRQFENLVSRCQAFSQPFTDCTAAVDQIGAAQDESSVFRIDCTAFYNTKVMAVAQVDNTLTVLEPTGAVSAEDLGRTVDRVRVGLRSQR